MGRGVDADPEAAYQNFQAGAAQVSCFPLGNNVVESPPCNYVVESPPGNCAGALISSGICAGPFEDMEIWVLLERVDGDWHRQCNGNPL